MDLVWAGNSAHAVSSLPRQAAIAGILSGVAAMASCSSVMPSLAPGLHDNAVAYNTAIGDINDRVLLSNIIRAREGVPLNITELSTVTGTLSEQATLGLSVPFGPGTAARGVVSPSVQFGAAPTFNMAALNTRGFTLNVIQPISPVYVASKWNSGLSHELLLLLFVKDIQFADSYAVSLEACAHSSTPPPDDGNGMMSHTPLVACHHKVINNPDSPSEHAAFKAVIESMLPTVGLKVMTILEPVGPAFPFLPSGMTSSGSAAAERELGVAKKAAAVQPQFSFDAYALTTHLNDGQYHVGNTEAAMTMGQLYHVYTNQVAVCANDPIKTRDGTFYIYPISADIAAAKSAELRQSRAVPTIPFSQDREQRLSDFKAQCAASKHPGDHACSAANSLTGPPRSAATASAFGSYSLFLSAVAGNSGGGSVLPESTGSGPRANGNSGAGSPSSVNASLQENRVGAFLRADDCYADQTVREPTTETEFRKYTETLGHIEWRSIAEVFQYLGAVLREPRGITWEVKADNTVVGSNPQSKRDSLFVLRDPKSADYAQTKVRVNTQDGLLAIGGGEFDTASGVVSDQSLIVLSMLSELVNSAKISSDIPVNQQLQVLP
jgi:hypothetical protein